MFVQLTEQPNKKHKHENFFSARIVMIYFPLAIRNNKQSVISNKCRTNSVCNIKSCAIFFKRSPQGS